MTLTAKSDGTHNGAMSNRPEISWRRKTAEISGEDHFGSITVFMGTAAAARGTAAAAVADLTAVDAKTNTDVKKSTRLAGNKLRLRAGSFPKSRYSRNIEYSTSRSPMAATCIAATILSPLRESKQRRRAGTVPTDDTASEHLGKQRRGGCAIQYEAASRRDTGG